jgi:hypothetical protein
MSHSPARNSQLPVLLLVILAATACGKSPPKQAGNADSVAFEQGNSGEAAPPAVVVPKDLVPVAFASAQTGCSQYHPGDTLAVPAPHAECKDYKISAKAHLDLTAADRANGTEDEWCVTVSYIRREAADRRWEDQLSTNNFTEHSGGWKAGQTSFGSC